MKTTRCSCQCVNRHSASFPRQPQNKNLLPEQFCLVLLDEAHNASGAHPHGRLVKELYRTGVHVPLVGLTTPGTTDQSPRYTSPQILWLLRASFTVPEVPQGMPVAIQQSTRMSTFTTMMKTMNILVMTTQLPTTATAHPPQPSAAAFDEAKDDLRSWALGQYANLLRDVDSNIRRSLKQKQHSKKEQRDS